MREEFFSKFIDYNQQLEKILETKDFSLEAKNLLLSMLYKIDISYSDYQTVKRKVKNKQEFLEDIIRIVENCETIELVKPNSEEGKEFEKEGIKYRIHSFSEEIRCFENETVILEALFELDNTRFYLPEKYNLIRIAFPDLLNEGKAMNNVEVIRDFNAWSWNILREEIHNIYANLIYQNIQILIDSEELEEWIETDEIENKIEWLIEKLEQENDKEQVKEFLTLIYQISIACCTNENTLEKKRLLEEKEILEQEYQKLSDRENYLEEITEKKKEIHRQIEALEHTLNDTKLLEQEYKKRNRALKQYNKIMSIEHLTEILNKQRKKMLKEIESYNEKLKPFQYIETMKRLKEQLNLLEDVKENKVEKKIIEKKMIRLQEIFLQFFREKMKRASKRELMDFIYQIRYYKRMPFNEEKDIKHVIELKGLLQEVEELALNRMYETKQMNKIAEDKNFNQKILRNIFDAQMIELENIYLQVKEKEGQYVVAFYDKEILEKEMILGNITKELQELKIKQNKIIKVFI